MAWERGGGGGGWSGAKLIVTVRDLKEIYGLNFWRICRKRTYELDCAFNFCDMHTRNSNLPLLFNSTTFKRTYLANETSYKFCKLACRGR